jgi:hypothetical protein
LVDEGMSVASSHATAAAATVHGKKIGICLLQQRKFDSGLTDDAQGKEQTIR